MVLDLIKLQHLSYLTIYKWSAIVTYDPMRYPKSDNYFLLAKICYGSSCGLMKWYDFFSFGKVFHNYKDPYVRMKGWVNWSH